MLKNENLPYLLTLLFVALGWTLTHFATQIGNSPIIEYKKTLSEDFKGIDFVIQNISRNTKFDNLHFYILFDDDKKGRCQGKPELKIYPPLHLGKDREEPTCNDNEIILKIKEFQPYSKILLSVKADKKMDAEITLTSKNAVRLIESNYQTFFVKFELEILISIILFWVVCIIFYFICLKREVPLS